MVVVVEVEVVVVLVLVLVVLVVGSNQVKIFYFARYYIVLYGYESYNMVGFEAEYR